MSEAQICHWTSTGWEVAPWNDGRGGPYTLLSPEAASQLQLPEPQEEAWFLVGRGASGPLNLPPGKKRKAQNTVVVTWGNAKGVVESTTKGARDLAMSDTKLSVIEFADGVSVIVWLSDGGNGSWESARQSEAQQIERQREEEQERQRLEAERRAAQQMAEPDVFINPYTFVPLPSVIDRQPPEGHGALAEGNLSGWFDWVLTFATPLLIGPHDATLDAASITYPGSSLRGVLRSLHESLAGGCLRAIDLDLAPVHREALNAYNPRDDLAVVASVDGVTGRVTQLLVSDRVVWIDSSLLPQPLDSGARISWTGNPGTVLGRQELSIGNVQVDRDGEWVVHITDANARRGRRYFVAAGHVPRNAAVRSIPEDDLIWDDFVRASAGSQDQIGVQPVGKWRHVSYGNRPIGRRRISDGRLDRGDTVWLTGDQRLKLAAVWRKAGQFPVGDRIPFGAAPCDGRNGSDSRGRDVGVGLCPTCAVFGSIDPNAESDHDQSAYGSHVRVAWGAVSYDGELSRVNLPPLREPKPSSGGFYLKARPDDPTAASIAETHVRQANWGAAGDKNGRTPRPIRGRKFYWHGQTQDQDGRHRFGPENLPPNDRPIAVPRPTLRVRVTFDNVTYEQLGWLIAAAAPQDILGQDCMIHVGRGKPLGYGSATPAIESLTVYSAESRYSTAPEVADARARAVEAARSTIPKRALEPVHRALRKILHPSAVPADRIWYPTAVPLDDKNRPKFGKSFEWFKDHSGGRKGDLVHLPDIDEPSQALKNR